MNFGSCSYGCFSLTLMRNSGIILKQKILNFVVGKSLLLTDAYEQIFCRAWIRWEWQGFFIKMES